ncbi:MAG: ATP-binding protein [Bacteroidales bacterium]|nr:ATP-binding protein [Bacteroidales bacterium]
MRSKKVAYNLSIRSLLIAITSALFGYISVVFIEKETFFIPFLLIILIIYQLIDLVRYVKGINQKIIELIKTLRASELPIIKDDQKESSFEQIRDTIQDLMNVINETKYEKEIHKQYLNIIINCIQVGLISFNQKQEIVLINNTAKNLLGNSKYLHLSDIKNLNSDFYTEIKNIENRNNKLIRLKTNTDDIALTISKSVFKVKNETITNITFQDIRNEIVQNEIESWRKLIKVLRHEILNSITPISTLTDTIISILNNEDGDLIELNQLNEEDLDDIRESMKSIKSRSEGLFEFVNIYREIDRIPTPKFENVCISELIDSTILLFNNQLKDKEIKLNIFTEVEKITIKADYNLIQQVIINLLKNSIEALETTINPVIDIHTSFTNNNIKIDVKDNGSGILENQISQIFVPMFTTKENGSGIGLFLSQQIMQLHKGNIKVISDPEKETIFSLTFHLN